MSEDERASKEKWVKAQFFHKSTSHVHAAKGGSDGLHLLGVDDPVLPDSKIHAVGRNGFELLESRLDGLRPGIDAQDVGTGARSRLKRELNPVGAPPIRAVVPRRGDEGIRRSVTDL